MGQRKANKVSKLARSIEEIESKDRARNASLNDSVGTRARVASTAGVALEYDGRIHQVERLDQPRFLLTRRPPFGA